jgi:ABC-type bacteriocin/lantibiotic exporter with double-glycine peptidase domain
VILLVASVSMGLLVLVLGVLQIAVFIFTRRKQRDLMSENLHIQAKSQSYQVEMLTGIETLKAMGSEQRAAEHWSDLFVDVLNVSLARGRLSAWIDSITSTLKLGSPLLILGMGALLVLQGNLSLGTMLALNALAAGFLGPLGNLVGTAGQLQILGSYLERIEDVMAAPAEQDPTKARQPAKLKGRISLDDVSFRYSPAAPMVVRNVSLEITPGQFVAIVGRSGSGKSTLASLLLGLYAPTAGSIRYDGVDLSELDLRSVRRQVGIVTQRPYLFGTTIRANIALSEPALPLDQVMDAARRARIDHEIAEMPLGYDSLLLDGGASLSGGQRQRVALARALVRQPAILLLDEATSSLDALTEREVQDELAKLNCTRVVIAHRLSTIVHAELILVLEDGKVVEQGRHDELLKRRGVYHHLVSAQLDGEAH